VKVSSNAWRESPKSFLQGRDDAWNMRSIPVKQGARNVYAALGHADSESMLVDAELHLPRVITIFYGDS
jgi:hypothetical protein